MHWTSGLIASTWPWLSATLGRIQSNVSLIFQVSIAQSFWLSDQCRRNLCWVWELSSCWVHRKGKLLTLSCFSAKYLSFDLWCICDFSAVHFNYSWFSLRPFLDLNDDYQVIVDSMNVSDGIYSSGYTCSSFYLECLRMIYFCCWSVSSSDYLRFMAETSCSRSSN